MKTSKKRGHTINYESKKRRPRTINKLPCIIPGPLLLDEKNLPLPMFGALKTCEAAGAVDGRRCVVLFALDRTSPSSTTPPP